jgi:hypothetical protein
VAAPSDRRRYCLLDFGVQLLGHQFVTEIDGVCENLSVGASVALDDNAIRSQKYTSIGRFQLFLKVFAPLAFTRNEARAMRGVFDGSTAPCASIVVVSAKTDRYRFCYIPFQQSRLFGAIERDGDYGSSAVLKSPSDQLC